MVVVDGAKRPRLCQVIGPKVVCNIRRDFGSQIFDLRLRQRVVLVGSDTDESPRNAAIQNLARPTILDIAKSHDKTWESQPEVVLQSTGDRAKRVCALDHAWNATGTHCCRQVWMTTVWRL